MQDKPMVEPLVRVEDLTVHLPVRRAGFFGEREVVHAVDGVTFDIMPGETLGLVGESGSGKTTTGRAILRRVDPTEGRIYFRGQDITGLSGLELRRIRRSMQMVFQDPYGSLNPRMSVLEIIAEPLLVHGVCNDHESARERVEPLARLVGLPADSLNRYPYAFSGGQRQRIGIARALAAEPDFIVVDEPVSALDVSIQAQIVNLLQDLQQELGLTYLFIAHDLSVVRHISDRVAIMYAGKIVEVAACEQIYSNPQHPYTKALLSSIPVPDPSVERRRERIILTGDIPDPVSPPSGCRFHTRCPFQQPTRCHDEVPELDLSLEHPASCHWTDEIAAGRVVDQTLS